MATTHFTTLSPAAVSLGLRNRLGRDLDELTRAAKGANTLPVDSDGAMFDMVIHLDQAIKALSSAIANLDQYRQSDRAAKLQAAEQAAALLNECFA